jgi:choline transport protein
VVIALINIGSTVAFNSVASLGTGTLTMSYIISISCIIWRKLCGKPLLPSQFNMGRRVGLAVNLLAVGFLCVLFVIAFFPPIPSPLLTVVSMNWVSDVA